MEITNEISIYEDGSSVGSKKKCNGLFIKYLGIRGGWSRIIGENLLGEQKGRNPPLLFRKKK